MVEHLKENGKRLIIALIVSSSLVAGFFTFLYIDISRKLELLSSTSGIFTPPTISPGEIYDKTTESVVLIVSRGNTSKGVTAEFKCSGFIYDKDGYIITVNSFITGAEKIRIKFTNGTEAEAEIVGFDEYSNLAVLKISGNSSITQRPLTFRDSASLHLTERVYIIGKLFGNGNSMISGEINRFRGTIWFKEEFPAIDVIEFSATLCNETLGAPLLNSKGEVIGVIIKLAEKGRVSSVGYALSSEMTKRIASSIIEKGNYTHPWLKGVRGMDLTQQIAEKMNINFTHGFLVTYININMTPRKLQSGNQTAIIEEGKNITLGGDIIIKINGREVKGVYDIIEYLEKYEYKNIGKRVTLVVFRDGKTREIQWEIGKVKGKILD